MDRAGGLASGKTPERPGSESQQRHRAGRFQPRLSDRPDTVLLSCLGCHHLLLRRPGAFKEAVSFAVVHRAFHGYRESLGEKLDLQIAALEAGPGADRTQDHLSAT